MNPSEVRWVIGVPDAAGGLELFRLAPLGAVLEFRAPDRTTAKRRLLESQATIPGKAILISRLEFEELQRAVSGRAAKGSKGGSAALATTPSAIPSSR